MSFSKTLIASSLAALLGAGALLSVPAVHAFGVFQGPWSITAYPNSLSDNAASDEAGNFCVLCHKTEAGTEYNGYGAALLPFGLSKSSSLDNVVYALRAIEALNSDGDPGGFSNIAEINADTQPGWKEGDKPPNPLLDNLLDPIVAVADIAVEPQSIDYGAVVLGTSVTGTEVTISNEGSAPLTVEALVLTGDPVFSLGKQTPATPFVIAAGAKEQVGVVYKPDAEGQDNGTLTIQSNDPDEDAVIVALKGYGVQPTEACVPTVDPTSLAFGDVKLGTSLELPVTLTNVGLGNCAVAVSVPNCIDGDFALTSGAAFALGSNESSIIRVIYTPSNVGQDQCKIEIATDGNDLDVPMSGAGVLTLPTDLDITGFTVSKTVSLSKGGIVKIAIAILNNGTETGLGTLTITGQQGDNQFVHQVVKVSDALGRGATKIKLQAYIPTATGEIKWTATLQDGDPDDDVATATTNVVK